jgi:hypothetical protein
MLQVVVCLGAGLIAFLSMVAWANNGRFKGDNDNDIV